MFARKTALFLGIICLPLSAGSLGRTTVEIASWRGNATAAYSIIHDDACGAGNLGIHENADAIAFDKTC